MHAPFARRPILGLSLMVSVALLSACGGDDAPSGPGGGQGTLQTASAIATPSAATVARGTPTNTTVVFTATGGLTIGSSFTINRQYAGLTVTQTSTSTSGTTITRGYTITADASVPAGAHQISFSTPVAGYTGNGSAPTAVAIFTLTVSP
ncbi:MAG: hypothetical protein IBJ03_10525 [Gemmatimonadaceae bacterium]|nr:hypothetical protein [Gemmatimonadaceae bacterium]